MWLIYFYSYKKILKILKSRNCLPKLLFSKINLGAIFNVEKEKEDSKKPTILFTSEYMLSRFCTFINQYDGILYKRDGICNTSYILRITKQFLFWLGFTIV